MSTAIPFLQSTSSTGATQTTTASSNATQTTQPAAQETVKISMAAQVKELNQEGLSASTIAAQLGLTVADVNQYLGIETAIEQALVQQAASLATGGKA